MNCPEFESLVDLSDERQINLLAKVGGHLASATEGRMATMNFENLSDELKEKVKSCETIEELKELAELEDIELSAEELNDIAGGRCGEYICPMKIRDKPRII